MNRSGLLASCLGLAALVTQLTPYFAGAAEPTPATATAAPAPAGAPLSDQEWKKNSSPGSMPERYQIVKHDTLWGISKRFFGDGLAWPKLYASNQDTISNPNLIYPGKWIVFVPGTGTSLPKLADQSSPNPAAPLSPANAGSLPPPNQPSDKIVVAAAKERSQEWKLLPKQSWEATEATLPPNTDALGFSTDNKIFFNKAKGIDLEAMAATEHLSSLGQIVGARTGGEYLSLGDTVYIRADEDIQLGVTYAITQDPSPLKSRKSDRAGYSYLILGKVKIIAVRDDLFVGTIVAGTDFIYRGNLIIPAPAQVPTTDPIAAPTSTEGVVMVDKHFSTFYSAQHKLIFIDRGTADGVQVGNVFRMYEHYDLSNEKKITSSDFIIDADAQVLQVSDRFCLAMIIDSVVPITENSTAVLLTDVSDLGSTKGFRTGKSGGAKAPPGANDELDELDKLDNSGGMGKDEQKELEQLEKWKGNPPGQPTPGALPTATPTTPPSEEIAPPPPAPASDAKTDELMPPPLPDSAPEPSPSKATTKMSPAPSKAPSAAASLDPAPPAPPSAPPPAPGDGGTQAPTDESKALDQLLNQ